MNYKVNHKNTIYSCQFIQTSPNLFQLLKYTLPQLIRGENVAPEEKNTLQLEIRTLSLHGAMLVISL